MVSLAEAVRQRRAVRTRAAEIEAQNQIALAEVAERQREVAARTKAAEHRRTVEEALAEAAKITLILAEADRRELERRQSDYRNLMDLNLRNGAKEPPCRPWFVGGDLLRFNVERGRLVNHKPLSGDKRLPLPFTGVGGDTQENFRQEGPL